MERLCHILDPPILHLVCTYPAATGGNKTRLCHVGKVYNFCRRSKNSKYLAVSPVMDNTEQLRPEAMKDLDIPISQSKNLMVTTRDLKHLEFSKKFRKI